MKKKFTTAILALFVLVLSSCSSDSANDTVNNDDTILLKKLVVVYEDGTQESATYTYNGTKLATTTYSNGRREITTYTGDLITKVETYDNNILTGEDLFVYDTNNMIITHTTRYLDENNGYRNTFAYNNNGTITTQEFYGDAATQTRLSNTGVLTVVDDNVMRHVFSFNGMSESVAYFTYDTKNNPNRNVTGFKQYSIATIYGGVNNITSRNDGSAVFTTAYTYNSDNYPISGVNTGDVIQPVTYYYTY